MARHRREVKQPAPQTGLPSEGWHDLVLPQKMLACTRRHLMVWQWGFVRGNVVLLVPRKDAPCGVVGVVLETTDTLGRREDMTDVPYTKMQLYWNDGTQMHTTTADVVNAATLRCLSSAESDRVLRGGPPTDEDWDYTRRRPEAPEVKQALPSRAVPAYRAPLERKVDKPATTPAAVDSRGGQRGWSF